MQEMRCYDSIIGHYVAGSTISKNLGVLFIYLFMCILILKYERTKSRSSGENRSKQKKKKVKTDYELDKQTYKEDQGKNAMKANF